MIRAVGLIAVTLRTEAERQREGEVCVGCCFGRQKNGASACDYIPELFIVYHSVGLRQKAIALRVREPDKPSRTHGA